MPPSLTSRSCLISGNMKMPICGLGTWQSTPEEIDLALKTAIEVGYRHIDTAYAYMNEAAIGQSLKKILAGGNIKREDLFIVTKLPHIANSPEFVETYIKRSLEALQLDYLDLYLIHNPVGFVNRGDEFFPRDKDGEIELDLKTDHIALWKAMEAQVDAGRAKSIGVSNFNLRQVKRLVENSRIPPANNQVELHIYLQQKELVSYCQQNNVTICAYAPLGSPHLKAFNKIISKNSTECKNIYYPMEDPVIIALAEKHNKTPAQILLRFLVQYGVAVIPKSTNPERIKQNFNIFDFELSDEDFAQISKLDRKGKGRMFSESNDFFAAMKKHPEYPWALE